MSSQSEQANWADSNEQHLKTAMRWLRLRLEQLACAADEQSKPEVKEEKRCGWFRCRKQIACSVEEDKSASSKTVALAQQELLVFEEKNPPPALLLLARTLELSPFDQNIILLCAAMELDSRIAGLCAKIQGGPSYPTFSLALALFDEPDWNFLSPASPLRHWRLLDIGSHGSQPLTSAALRLDERILGFLKGSGDMDARLTALLDFVLPNHEALPPSLQAHVDSIAHRLQQTDSAERLPPVIELLGHDAAGKQVIAAQAAAALGLSLYMLEQKSLSNDINELEQFIRLWERESRLLLPLALLIRVESNVNAAPLRRFLERSSGVVFLDLEDGRIESSRERFSVEISKPTPEEQEQLWIAALNGPTVGGLPQRLAEQFSFAPAEINKLARLAAAQSPAQNQTAACGEHSLWQLCRSAARSGMEQLAQRLEVKADWCQLILPKEQKDLLDQVAAQVHQRNRVYDDWGFRQRMNRGLGINALFSGESGTGKTMAAEVIAQRLDLDMYRIDLSTVVSKYIGETEKNLRKLFDAAEDSGAILFFDEADALFGKRSEVKDSHDRYANIEVNYLLQRMETYRGLAILASNVRTALDKAFLRRLRFIVEFPFPGPAERQVIWEKVFPADTPTGRLDYAYLAKLNLTGGSIHNVALNAAFLAAQEGCGKVTMPLILAAARTEFKKIERPFREADFLWKEPAADAEQVAQSVWQQQSP